MRLGKALKTFCGNCACKDFPSLALLGDGDKRSRFQFSLFPEGYVNKNVLTNTGFCEWQSMGHSNVLTKKANVFRALMDTDGFTLKLEICTKAELSWNELGVL